jgi:hypothetical protein
MRRWIARILICLVLGAATTVLVAWGGMVAMWRLPRTVAGMPWRDSADNDGRFLYYTVGNAQVYLLDYRSSALWQQTSGFSSSLYNLSNPLHPSTSGRAIEEIVGSGLACTAPGWFAPWNDDPAVTRVQRSAVFAYASGWPMLAVAGAQLDSRDPGVSTFNSWVVLTPSWAIECPNAMLNAQACVTTAVLPLRPVLPGFAVNTAIFTLSWAIPIFFAPLARRVNRRRRNHCTNCNYDLRNLPGTTDKCPECGTARPLVHTEPVAALSAPRQ